MKSKPFFFIIIIVIIINIPVQVLSLSNVKQKTPVERKFLFTLGGARGFFTAKQTEPGSDDDDRHGTKLGSIWEVLRKHSLNSHMFLPVQKYPNGHENVQNVQLGLEPRLYTISVQVLWYTLVVALIRHR